MSIRMPAFLNPRLTTRRRRRLLLDARAASVLDAPHDISPSLDEQLVLELKCGVALDEAV